MLRNSSEDCGAHDPTIDRPGSGGYPGRVIPCGTSSVYQRSSIQGASTLASVEGIAEKSAIAILIRMPEIGTLSREQVTALAGLAPYDDDSGRRAGSRHIQGGRTRLRSSLYAAALPAAFFWNPQLITFYKRLRANGKTHKMALVACARKLLIFINTVVARATPWQPKSVAS